VRGRAGLSALPVAGAVLLVSVLLALPPGVSAAERAVFRDINDLRLPLALLWPVMQLGNVLAVPVAAAVAALAGRRRLSFQLLAAGLAAYVLAKVLKALVGRGRPDALLDGVHLVDTVTGPGLPSGHAAVAAALVHVTLPHLRSAWRWAAGGCLVLVCLARLAVGAHLPLDVVAGAALGIVLGATARRAVRRPCRAGR
jgi:undecaprenyl-diphosphatase